MPGIITCDCATPSERRELRKQHAQALARTAVRERNLALKAFDTLVNEVQDKLGNGSANRAVRRSLLDTAIAGLSELASEDDAFAPDLGRAVAYLKLGEVYRQVGRILEARKEFERSIELARKLNSATPHDVSVLECLCRGFGQVGYSILLEDRPFDALPLLKDAARSPKKSPPRNLLASTFAQLRIKSLRATRTRPPLGPPDQRVAGRLSPGPRAGKGLGRRRAPKADQANLQLASSYIKLGDVEDLAGEVAQSRSYFNEAIALCRAGLAADPDESTKIVLQTALNNLARLESAQHNNAAGTQSADGIKHDSLGNCRGRSRRYRQATQGDRR